MRLFYFAQSSAGVTHSVDVSNRKTDKSPELERGGNVVPDLKQRVFVVDDERVISSTLELMLISRGFDARSFTDPLAALKVAQSQSPDLLITDLLMPKMTGIELAVQIRRDCPHCKVMLFSGQVSIINLLAQAQADGHDFVLVDKPTHPAIIVERIHELLQDTGGVT
jgi:CheY-like chemotaxis protein